MNSRERLLTSINHKEPDVIPVDFGGCKVTGIHCKTVEALRDYYGLEKKPVRIIETYQMLGEIDDELAEIMGVDTIRLANPQDIFGNDLTHEHEQLTPWGQEVLVSSEVDLTTADSGDIYVYPGGDKSVAPTARMVDGGYFFNPIERYTEEVDDDDLDIADNLAEFQPRSDEDIKFLGDRAAELHKSGRAVVAEFEGTALGDVSLVPGLSLKDPKGVRTVQEWYISLMIRPEYIQELFERQIDVAIENYKKYWQACGENVDVVFICGTDFGTQESQFVSVDQFNEMWLPSYKRLTDWIHQNTTWKILKHTDGSVGPLMPCMVESGIDCLNPIQFNAAGMEPEHLKKDFGDQLALWGGIVDTQKQLETGTTDDVRKQVRQMYDLLGAGGGYVANTVHNIQANHPLKNVVAMTDELNAIRGRTDYLSAHVAGSAASLA